MTRRRSIALLAVVALALVVALPAFAAPPDGKTPPGQAKDKVAKAPITLNGTIASAAGAEGETSYTLTQGGTTYTLEAGPRWFFEGGTYPLDQYVGDPVTVEGEVAEGSTEVDVISVNGTALRAAGKPPWAGGWKRVGNKHPGWSQQKADRFEARFGDCWPPGHCKEKPGKGNADDGEDAAGD